MKKMIYAILIGLMSGQLFAALETEDCSFIGDRSNEKSVTEVIDLLKSYEKASTPKQKKKNEQKLRDLKANGSKYKWEYRPTVWTIDVFNEDRITDVDIAEKNGVNSSIYEECSVSHHVKMDSLDYEVYAVEDRAPRACPWVNEPEAGQLADMICSSNASQKVST